MGEEVVEAGFDLVNKWLEMLLLLMLADMEKEEEANDVAGWCWWREVEVVPGAPRKSTRVACACWLAVVSTIMPHRGFIGECQVSSQY